MEGRENVPGQNLHSRGHHYGHGIYPFSNHWPSYSPSNGSTSSSGKSSSPIGTSTTVAKTSATSHVTTSSSHSGLGLSWWHPPPFSSSDMHHFSSPPWSSHERLEPLSVSRDSSGPVFHGSHSRNGPPHHPSSIHTHAVHTHHSHAHSYHHGRGNHLHGGTLIHFPHSSSHQSLSSKDETSKSSIDHSSSPNQKDSSEQHSGAVLPGDSNEREQSWEDLVKLHNRHGTFSPHMRIERSAKHSRFGEGMSDEEPKGTRSPSDERRCEEKDALERTIDEKNHLRHATNYDERGHEGISSGRSDHRHSHGSALISHTASPSYISSVSEMALASAKASYLNKDASERGYLSHSREDKHHSPYPFSSHREMDVASSKLDLMSPDSHSMERGFDQNLMEKHLIKHDHHRDHTPYRESGGLKDDRMNRAEATREWVNKQPALHVSSNYDHYIKPDKRAKNSEPSPLNRKSDSPNAAKAGKHEKGGSSSDKDGSKKDQHYDSPLNSSLPRYTVGSHVMKVESERSEMALHQRSRNPFNVDFLRVSADTDGQSRKEIDRPYHLPISEINSLDRVSVIRSPLPVHPLSRGDTSNTKKVAEIAKPHLSQRHDNANFSRPNSLVESHHPPMPVVPLSGKPRSLVKPDDLSPRNSDSDSSSEDDSGDQVEERRHGSGKQINEKDWDMEQDATENDEIESKDASEDQSGSGSDGEESSGSGTGSDDDETQSQSTQDTADNSSVADVSFEKRKWGELPGTEPKRRKIVDENLISIPLQEGWRRQTRIKATGNGESLRGDVYYFAPCGKKIRTYPELLKYLEKNGIQHLGLDNFSFSTKTTVGEFMESRQGSKFEVLSEEEVLRRHSLEKERQIARSETLAKKRERKRLKNESAKRAHEAKIRRKAEKQAALEAKLTKKAAAEEKRMKKENERQQREMARRSKKEALQHAKMEEALRKARDREMKRQQTVILKQQEKERRKQHLMMIRALESQRKAEERERKKEEKKLEKKLLKQRKMEQRRLEKSIARELKKPIDDMALNDGKPLPEFSRIKGVLIPGRAYADLLMVEEFVYCFGHVLDIDPETDFPSLADLQSALLNESTHDDALVSACESLLTAALQDPGVAIKTKLGVSLENIELNDANISEMLRLFIIDRNDGTDNELSSLMTEKPIHSLSPVQKAEVLAFLVNELLCSEKIYNEMDNCLEHMSNLRRDKWNMEGRIRKLKADLKSKKVEKGTGEYSQGIDNDYSVKAKSNQSKKKVNAEDDVSNASMAKDDDDDEDEEDDDEEEKDTDEEDADEDEAGDDDNDEDQSEDTDDGTDPTTVEEIEKRVAKLEKKHSKYRHKLFTASHTLRGLCIGQDRYKRRYHILPHAGGVYVEGLESGELDVDKQIFGKNIAEEKDKKRKRSSSSQSVSDSNLTPTGEQKPQLPIDGEIPANQMGIADVKSPRQKNAFPTPVVVSPILKKLDSVFDSEVQKSFSNYGDMVSPKQEVLSPKTRIMSPRGEMVSPTGAQYGISLKSPTDVKESSMKWFHLFPKKACDETSLTRSSIIPPTGKQAKLIIPPNVASLGQDRKFCESIADRHMYMHGSLHGPHGHHHHHHHHERPGYYDPTGRLGNSGYHGAFTPNGNNPQIYHYPGLTPNSSNPDFVFQYGDMTKAEKLGLAPPGVDIQKLIKQDPQEAAVLLDIQSIEPAPVPEDKSYGWWRISDSDVIHRLLKSLHTRGFREKMLHKSLTRYTDYACSSCRKNNEAFSIQHKDEEENKEVEPLKSPKKEKHKSLKPTPPGKIEDRSFPQAAFSVDKDILIEIEELEEKMFSASLQNKTWRLSQKASSNLTYVKKESKQKPEEKPLELAKGRLLALEKGIERRYLKPPFRLEKHPNQAQIAKGNGENSQGADGTPSSSDKDWKITPSLLLWRETVESCTSASQLSMCIGMLKDCIAWERSIMKVFCIECRKGDNEDLLLLCDQCDRGCHTYCCTPKLSKIPDGDWFCRECIMMASGSDQCYGCQGSTGKRLKCQFCPRYYHLFCLDPPLQKTPRSPWACPVCKKARLKSKRTPKRKRKPEDEFDTFSSFEAYEQPSKQGRSKKDKMNNRKQAMKHMQPCRQMLAEMERHECSWPFLVPVNAKQFPEYYQIIKNPMDFHTMKVKLRDFQYKSREEFANDARLVFRNCDIFNEDDSEVGQAGKKMLKFFEKRWIEVLANESQSKGGYSEGDKNGTADESSEESEGELDDDGVDDDDDDEDDDGEDEEE